jgi:hypothetical protein
VSETCSDRPLNRKFSLVDHTALALGWFDRLLRGADSHGTSSRPPRASILLTFATCTRFRRLNRNVLFLASRLFLFVLCHKTGRVPKHNVVIIVSSASETVYCPLVTAASSCSSTTASLAPTGWQ